jgi:MIP family channel proteins
VRNTLARRCAAEAAGAFILVLIGPGAAAVDRSYAHGALGPVGVALAFFLALLTGIAAFAPVSGAHFNPAVTLGFWSIGRFRGSEVVPYVVAQCGGATLAAFLLSGAVGDAVIAATTVPAISIARAFAVEFVFSAILMAVILRVSSDERVSASLAAISVSACVGGLALMGALTGSSMNPARSFGPALASGEWTAHWIYWAAPISGMVCVAWLFTKLARDAQARGLALESPLGVEGPIETAIAE